MNNDTKLYYCSAGGHLWYYDENGKTALFYKNINDATDEEVESAEDKYCGCNE